jgi:hypothetical protein
MESTNSNNINKDKYKRPGVVEVESFKSDSVKNEKDSASIDGPYRDAQTARGLEPGAESQSRVIISQESNRVLDGLALRVNTGFDAGKVTRPQILSWVLKRFAETAEDDEIQELRAAHFDKIAYLEALVKRAKETGVIPPELSAALQPPCAPAHAPKKTRRPLTKNITNDEIINVDTYTAGT